MKHTIKLSKQKAVTVKPGPNGEKAGAMESISERQAELLARAFQLLDTVAYVAFPGDADDVKRDIMEALEEHYCTDKVRAYIARYEAKAESA